MTLYSSASFVGGGGNRASGFELDAHVDQQGGVSAVIDDGVRAAAVGPVQHLLGAPPVLLEASRPSRRRPGHPGGCLGVPSGPTTTAAAAWSWVEKMLQLTQRTSAPRAVRVSMRTAVCTVMCSEPTMLLALERLRLAELRAQRHQAGHLVLGQLDLLAAERGQRQVGNLEVADASPALSGVRVVRSRALLLRIRTRDSEPVMREWLDVQDSPSEVDG